LALAFGMTLGFKKYQSKLKKKEIRTSKSVLGHMLFKDSFARLKNVFCYIPNLTMIFINIFERPFV